MWGYAKSVVVCTACLVSISAFAPACSSSLRPLRQVSLKSSNVAQLDMNDPAVNEMFEKVQGLPIASVEYELDTLGIPCDPTLDDMSKRLMLMETRIRLDEKGAASGSGNKPKDTASTYEKVCFEKPKIRQYADSLYDKGDINAYNTFVEYINSPDMAKARYADIPMYKAVMDKADEMMAAPAFTSAKLKFSGFPAGMGADMIKMSFEEFGPLKTFEVANEDDVMAEAFDGVMEYETADAAMKCVARYDGADMGMGTALSLEYL